MKKIINIVAPILILLILILVYYHKINSIYAVMICFALVFIQFYINNYTQLKDKNE